MGHFAVKIKKFKKNVIEIFTLEAIRTQHKLSAKNETCFFHADNAKDFEEKKLF
jgi:hypothetical protein